MTSLWPTVKLGELCEIQRGGSPRPIDEYITDASDGINWIKIGDVGEGEKYIRSTRQKIRPEGAQRSRHVESGDFLLTNSMSFGRPYILRTSGCIHDGWLVLRYDRERLSEDYLYHALSSDAVYAQFVKMASGAVVKNLNSEVVKAVEVLLPPLPEQRRIAAILDKADALRTKRREALAQLDRLAQSFFLEMFGDPATNPRGWTSRQLGAICEVRSSKRVFVEELVDAGVPFYRGTEVGQLGEGEVVLPSLFISHDHYERLKAEAGAPSKGDLLLPSICPDGRIYIVDTDKPFYFKDARVLWIKVDQSGISSTFLQHYLKLRFAKDYSNIASGTTFAELKIFALKSLDVHLPPMDLQQRFADAVAVMESQRLAAKSSYGDLSRLFQSLKFRAFRGEL